MKEAALRHHRNRWERSEQARRAMLEAVDDLLAERGFAGVTIEGIAAGRRGRPAAFLTSNRVLVTGEPVGRPFTDRLVDG